MIGIGIAITVGAYRAGGIADTPAVALFDADAYTVGIDDDQVMVNVTGATIGEAWEIEISSSGGGTPVADMDTISAADFTIGPIDCSGLNAGTLTLTYFEDSVEEASDTAALLFSPLAVSGLGIWLDADDASTIMIATGVSQWNDKSGNGRHFSQASTTKQPSYQTAAINGRNVVRADGTNDGMQSAIGLSLSQNVAGMTIFACRLTRSSPTSGENLFKIDRNVTNSGRYALANGSTSGKLRAEGRTLDADANAFVDSSANTSTTDPMIQCGVWDNANSDLTQYVNGSVDGATTSYQSNNNTSNTASASHTMFENTSGSAPADVDLCELIVYPRVLTQGERESIEGYLAHKWGIASALPALHPYRNSAP